MSVFKEDAHLCLQLYVAETQGSKGSYESCHDLLQLQKEKLQTEIHSRVNLSALSGSRFHLRAAETAQKCPF